MPRINVSRVINNPKFAQKYTVYRKTGDWVVGRWVASDESEIIYNGVVTAPNAKEILQVPEGDRIKGVMCFHATKELYVTSSEGTSDEILWNGNRYRVSQVMPWVDYGYWKAFGIRMEAD